jgi:hypothetical protein
MFVGQLSHSGFSPASPTVLAHAHAAFHASHALLLNRFVERTLLEEWQRRIDAAPFVDRVAKGEWGDRTPSVDQRIDDRAAWGGCIFAMNDPALFATVERVTGCVPIGSFFGSIYRIVAGRRHFHSWHNDLDGNRLVALSVNLSPNGYRGGVLQIAARKEEAAGREATIDTPGGRPMLAEIANTGWGDAVIFEISEALEHRVNEVEAGPDKTAFAGWFVRSPSRSEWLRAPVAAANAAPRP